jgi:hypothetical protein
MTQRIDSLPAYLAIGMVEHLDPLGRGVPVPEESVVGHYLPPLECPGQLWITRYIARHLPAPDRPRQLWIIRGAHSASDGSASIGSHGCRAAVEYFFAIW